METTKNIINEEKVVISPEGEIDFTNSQTLKRELLDLFNDGYKDVIIDFGDVEGIDSSGLGKLLLFHKKLKEKEGKLTIRNIQSEYIRNMFDMIHLHKVIEIED
ncbi:MAG: STAS domain-containing protein [Halanaerobiales bacterium]